MTNKENVIEQIKGVSELIAEFIAELSKHFVNLTVMKMTRKNSVQWFTGHRLQRLDFAGRTVKVSMHTAIRFPAHVDKVHRLVNLVCVCDETGVRCSYNVSLN